MDDNNGELDCLKIDRDRAALMSRGGDSGGGRTGGSRDPRFTALLRWAWAAIGSGAVLIGWGVYNKLSTISDTLIVATSDIKNQGNQMAEMKVEVRDLRASQASMQRQIDSLEGKTLRGFEEASRGR